MSLIPAQTQEIIQGFKDLANLSEKCSKSLHFIFEYELGSTGVLIDADEIQKRIDAFVQAFKELENFQLGLSNSNRVHRLIELNREAQSFETNPGIVNSKMTS